MCMKTVMKNNCLVKRHTKHYNDTKLLFINQNILKKILCGDEFLDHLHHYTPCMFWRESPPINLKLTTMLLELTKLNDWKTDKNGDAYCIAVSKEYIANTDAGRQYMPSKLFMVRDENIATEIAEGIKSNDFIIADVKYAIKG